LNHDPPQPFKLTNDPTPPPRQAFSNNDGKQKKLFIGMDCLPDQQDLFETDGADYPTDPEQAE
tara:strand:- start:387 stop:575 length:189 start_codon:yes stop_codon:yes gene_type:complete